MPAFFVLLFHKRVHFLAVFRQRIEFSGGAIKVAVSLRSQKANLALGFLISD
jgi:hypothetical protein